MNMKKIYSFLALAAVMCLSSCEKFLDTKPTDFLSPVNYYQTEAHLNFARASVYNTLGEGGLWGSHVNYLHGWAGDEGYMNRATLTTGPWNYNFGSADSYLTTYWNTLYIGINRANVVLANLDRNPDISQAVRDKIRGEVLFLRGFYHFLLVQYFGGVPVKTEPTASIEDVDLPRNTVREVYEQIIKDMEAAEPLVPSITSLGFGGAVSKSAVRGILARVNLHMAGHPLKDESRYAEVKRWAKMIMDDPAHSINPSYPDIFIKLAGDKYDIKESIFEVEFWGNRLGDEFTETTNHCWINGPTLASNPLSEATGRADAYMSITAKLWNSYEPGDLRKFWNICHFVYTATGVNGSKNMANPATTEVAKYNLRPAKFRREYETLTPKSQTTTPQNVSLLRFTDVLMMYAEAENAINGPTPEAVEIVNQIRRRSWSTGIKAITVTNRGSGYTSAPTVTISGGGATEQAVATATVGAITSNLGQITAVTLARDQTGVKFSQEGSNYTSAPTVTITGGGGTGATATATIYKLEDADLKPEQYASKQAFLETIQDERMREFCFELSRKADLLRWGIFLQVCRDMGNQTTTDAPGQFYIRYYTNVSERNLLYPIPSAEMTVNQAMVQNEGWQ